MNRQDHDAMRNEDHLASLSRWGRLREKSRRPRGPKPAQIPGIFYSFVFLASGITAYFAMESATRQVMERVLPLPEGTGLLGWETLAAWLIPLLCVSTIMILSKRKKNMVRWRNTPKPLLAFQMAALTFFGAVAGHVFFMQTELRTRMPQMVENFEQFSKVKDTLPLFDGKDSDLWFSEDGRLRVEKQEAWCARVAMAEDLLGWTDGSSRLHSKGLAGLLDGSILNHAHAQGCLDDTQWLEKKRQIHHAATQSLGVDQAINQAFSWSPLFNTLNKTDDIIAERLILSPSTACVHLVGQMETGDGGELFEYCHEALPTDRWVSAEELQELRAKIAGWME